MWTPARSWWIALAVLPEPRDGMVGGRGGGEVGVSGGEERGGGERGGIR